MTPSGNSGDQPYNATLKDLFRFDLVSWLDLGRVDCDGTPIVIDNDLSQTISRRVDSVR